MRNIIFFIVFTFPFILYSQNSNGKVMVQGKLTNAGNIDSIYLDRLAGKPREVAIAEIAKDGSYSFEVNASKTDIYRIRITDPNTLLVILEPGDTLELVSNAFQLNSTTKLSGSLETMKVYAVGPYVSRFEKHLDSLSKVYQNSRKLGNVSSEELKAIQTEYQQVRERFWNFLRENIQRDPGSMAWLFFIEKLDIEKDFKLFDEVAQALVKKYPDNFYVNNLVKKVEGERRLAVGSPAPEIRLPNPEGDTVALSELRGNVVLIDFWAGWCGPCRRENPNVVRMYKRFNKHGFEIYGVSLDRTRKSWLDAIEKDQLTWTQVSDLKYWKSDAAKSYQVSSIPHTVLIDRDGKILAKKLRGKALEEKLESLFPEAD